MTTKKFDLDIGSAKFAADSEARTYCGDAMIAKTALEQFGDELLDADIGTLTVTKTAGRVHMVLNTIDPEEALRLLADGASPSEEEPDILDPSRSVEREVLIQRNITEFENVMRACGVDMSPEKACALVNSAVAAADQELAERAGFLVADETHISLRNSIPARPATAAEIAASAARQAACDPGCAHAPLRTEPVAWTIGWQDSFGRECPEGPYASAFAKPIPTQEHQDAPNAAPLPDTADASETGSPASPAASGGNPEDWSWHNAPEMASDVVEAEMLARVAPAHYRSPDLSPNVWAGIGGSQSVVVKTGGRFHAVDECAPIKD